MASALTMACPHCEARARVRTSRRVTVLVTDMIMACTDPECGGTFAAQLTVVRMISPSGRPNPSLQLPTAPAGQGRRNDIANDNDAEEVRHA